MTERPTAEQFTLGIMKTSVSGKETERFDRLLERAVQRLRQRFDEMSLDLNVFTFEGPPLVAAGGRLEPLEYLELGLAEKLERRVNFLLIVTESDLESSKLSYVVAYPSRLTNIGLISVRRLLPDFWGADVDDETGSHRLLVVMLHTFGHLLNLDHANADSNVMHDFSSIDALDEMTDLDPGQLNEIERNIPAEAHDEQARGSSLGFWWEHVRGNWGVIGRTLRRANPIRLITKLPTLLTAALSVVAVLFFSAEVWDVADAVDGYQVVLFMVLTVAVATAVLYRTFGFGALLDRERLVSESTVVTQTTTLLAVFLTVLTLFVVFFALTLFAAVTIFPRALMAEWASIDAADDFVDHVKLSTFLGSMAVLTGALGGRGDSKKLIRTVLFLDEET